MAIIVDLGQEVPYRETFALQKELVSLRSNGKIKDTLLFLEHKKVITIGNSGNPDNILFPTEFLLSKGFEVEHINRGGDVTYHGPGQIVGYFIFNIYDYGTGVKEFFFKLEEIFIRLLKDYYDLDAYRDEKYPGVWINGEKITALGCAIKKGISMHGFGFNVNTNMEDFKAINPCGITEKGVTSLEKITGKKLDIEEVKKQLKKSIEVVFGIDLKETAKDKWLKEIDEWKKENQNG